MCQDSIGWKAPVRSQHPSTPPKQQRPADLSMQQDQEMQAPHDDGDVEIPTASANGPAVQPVSAEKAKKGSKGEVKQAACASDGDQAGASGPEDPEKKAKKVTACKSANCTHGFHPNPCFAHARGARQRDVGTTLAHKLRANVHAFCCRVLWV